MPNAWDRGSAVLLASLGFPAIATTSSGFAATLGRLDGGVTRDEALGHAADARRRGGGAGVGRPRERLRGRPRRRGRDRGRRHRRRPGRLLDRGLRGRRPTTASTTPASPSSGWRRRSRSRTPGPCTSCSPPGPRTTSTAATTSTTPSPGCRPTSRRGPTCCSPRAHRADDIRPHRVLGRPPGERAGPAGPSVGGELAELGVGPGLRRRRVRLRRPGAVVEAARELLDEGTYGYLERAWWASPPSGRRSTAEPARRRPAARSSTGVDLEGPPHQVDHRGRAGRAARRRPGRPAAR